MKRSLFIILSLLLLLSSFPLLPQTANALVVDKSEFLDNNGYRKGAWFDNSEDSTKAGNFYYITTNRKASTPIRYTTVKFIVRFDDPTTGVNEGITCDGDSSAKSECTPLKGGSQQYLVIDLNEYKENPVKYKDYVVDKEECKYAAEVGASQANCNNDIYVTKFTLPAQEIVRMLWSSPAFLKVKENTTLYFSPIFKVKVNDVIQPGEYSTLSAIRDRKPSWNDSSVFRQQYDVPVTFHSDYDSITVKYLKESNREQLKDKEVIKGPSGIGFKAMDKTQNVPILDSIQKDDNLWTVSCVYIKPSNGTVEPNCTDAAKVPYVVRGADTKTINPPMFIGGTDVIILYKPIETDCDCMQQATIPDKSSLEGVLPKEQSVIGKIVPMKIDLQQKPTDLDKWKKWVKNKSDFNIRIVLYRSDNTLVLPIANTGATAKWSKSGNAPDFYTSEGTGGMALSSASSLISYLEGTTKIIYNDDLMNYPIPPGSKVSFRYNAKVVISAKDSTGKTISKTCSNVESTALTWIRPREDLTGGFISSPQYWSEIKEGSPQTAGTSSNETFDAMSGTPTTRSLYFASGGSEFVVDVEVEYVSNITQQRTYRSYFTPVVNGWAMDEITGGIGHKSAPSKPQARTMTDDAGQSYTETVSLHSFKHVIEPAVPCSGNPCTGGKPEVSETDYYWVQEGYDSHTVGGYEDTWTQTVTFDYMRLNKAVVWKLDRSKVNGMTELVGTNEVTATVKQGDPNIFFNQSTNNNSADGRLRYSLETDQHDHVVWYEGSSDNSLANNKQGKVNEQKKFDERRALQTNVTAISDFLILQTSSGDQSVMYFQKNSNTAKTTEQLDVPTTDFHTMWTNNPLSAAKWDTRNTIKIGSYNGQYASPLTKYSGASTGTVTTIFDSKPAGLNRPSHPSPYMRLMATGLDVPDRLENGLVRTGTASVFYKLILNKNAKNLPVAYSIGTDGLYNDKGQAFDSAYSPMHAKVNDVVIHNPVSVQNAIINSLPSYLDQRTDTSKALGGNKQEPVYEYERVLDPNYRQNIVPNGDAEIVNVNGSVAGWETNVLSGNPSLTSNTGLLSGTSFVIGGTGTGSYTKDIAVKPNVNYQFDGSIGTTGGSTGYFKIDVMNAGGTVLQSGLGSSSAVSGSAATKSYTLTTPSSAATVRISIVKSAASGTVYADNVSLKNMTTQEFIAVEGVYVSKEVPNPDYKPATSATAQVFDYTGSVQTFTAPGTGTYTIEAWGAQGGTASGGGLGGYAKGQVDLVAGEMLSIYVGGNTGWNGGGSGHGRASDAGGGASDVRRGGTTLYDRIIVAGGGGGSSGGRIGGSGGGNTGGTGGDGLGTPGTGATQTSGGAGGSNNGGSGTFGQGGSNNAGSNSGGAGGGGGYYGGGAGGNDYPSYNDYDDSGGGGGSGYIGGVKSGSMQNGVRSGNGQVSITAPPMPAEGIPTVIASSLAGGADTSPPAEAYKLVAKALDPTTSASGKAAGFIVLDHEFTLNYPNTGDFYGNGQWGWPSTTDIRGKGFVDGMDTTEWTKAKYVKFNFNVIYGGVMYKADSWISLDVPTTKFTFYLPLANRERISALVEFKSIAINAPYEDNDTFTNRVRYGSPKLHAARHSTLKSFDIDVVGRIGNMVIEDTGDFRFSNFFKQPLSPTQWLVPNVVKKVDESRPNKLIGDQIDIRGEIVGSATRYLDTYGLLPHLRQAPKPVAFPLSPEKNNIAALQNQPLRAGYKVYTDLQTIGNYYGDLQVVPYYYHLNLKTGAIQPVDIYMDVKGEYKPINKFGAVAPGWNPASVYSNPVYLDWNNEYARRNVSAEELEWTAQVANLFINSGGDSATGKAAQPHDNYLYGNSQLMQLTGRNRTYIGQDNTYGVDRNPGNMLSTYEYAMQAQRWHFHYGLPSSAVAVRKGQPATQANIKELRTNTSVLLMAADITAVGDTYTLRYDAPNNQSVNIAGTSWSLNGIPYPVVAVYSSSKSSADDLTISGTH